MAEKLIAQPRDLPSVEEILQHSQILPHLEHLPRPFGTLRVRQEIDRVRTLLADGGKPIAYNALIAVIADRLHREGRKRIVRVINATGILVHTNLGRAPLSALQLNRMIKTIAGYSNLEFDLETGERGSRGEACEAYIALLCGSEAATVVNNCAAALFLILNTLANRKSVIISRSELVQIGGGFRVPDILRKSGAKLVEVGTSNITTLADHTSAINDSTGVILKVHKSNFALTGFSEEVSLRQLAELGKLRNIPVVHDLGSGAVVATSGTLGQVETTVQQSVRDGASLTCCSGDKLLGGPQAGIIVGNHKDIGLLKKNPLFRTMRVDKIMFALLEELVCSYLQNNWQNDIALWKLASTPLDTLKSRAENILSNAGKPDGVTVVDSEAQAGGGSLPEQQVPSVAIRFAAELKPRKLIEAFRRYDPPIIGRVFENSFLLDLKAVDESEDSVLAHAIAQLVRH